MPVPAVPIASRPYLPRQSCQTIPRLHKPIQQQELADRAKVTQSAIAAFEAGNREIRTDTLRRICEALDVKVQYIIGDTIITGP